MRRVVGAFFAAGVVLICGASNAGAERAPTGYVTTGGQPTGSGGAVGVAIGSSGPGAPGSAPKPTFSGPPIRCTYKYAVLGLPAWAQNHASILQDGLRYYRTCQRGDVVVSGPDLITYAVGVPSPAENAQVAAQAAFASLEVPSTTIGASPLDGVTLPNLDTWFWVDDTETRSQSVSLGGVTATVTAKFAGVTFQIDDGANSSEVHCVDGGTPYDPSISHRDQDSECTWRFEGGSRTVEVVAVAEWELAWTSSVGVGGDLDDVPADAVIDVEVQALRSVIRHK